MNFEYDEEQDALRDSVGGLLGKAYGDFEQRRATVAAEPGFDEKTWQRLAELGVLGLPFAEAHGGMGAGPVEVSVVCEELGRTLAPEPYLAAVVLAGGLVDAAGTEDQCTAVLTALSEGAEVPAFAHLEPGARWSSSAGGVTATQTGSGWRLDGVKEPVPHGASADLLVVSAALPDAGTGLFLVDPSSEGVDRQGYPTHDGGRAARVALTGASATPLGEAVDREATIAAVLDRTRVAACHQALGAMSFQLEATTSYLKSRKQFGVTLNKFQALTFRAADLYVSLELARSITLWATLVLTFGSPEEASDAAARASLQVSRAGRHIGQEAIQLHGGIGMTAEYAVGHYTSHLTALEHWLGDGRHHLATLSAQVGDHGEVDPLR
ncbi:MAG TPA: acyl-CoA dehydrogenase family protein [Nocardioides sp.]|uniref:acyl-CoA dehydrogenase family protein n=1 Tax=Nocardioides sp. TaxID=35761 RepID=UPI002D7F13E1|nr:acyl-CoA dehydrogenase family protein [Nocardioides sp.]HET6652504.1 acyl-CoA dehydrogenase family protein [Nocardioides sp.]